MPRDSNADARGAGVLRVSKLPALEPSEAGNPDVVRADQAGRRAYQPEPNQQVPGRGRIAKLHFPLRRQTGESPTLSHLTSGFWTRDSGLRRRYARYDLVPWFDSRRKR